jgi:hypothetical protein
LGMTHSAISTGAAFGVRLNSFMMSPLVATTVLPPSDVLLGHGVDRRVELAGRDLDVSLGRVH